MDPQKFGDSYDFVKSVPRQLFLPARCLKSNVTKLQSYKVSWRIQSRNWRAGRRRRKDSLQRIGEPDLCVRHAAIRLIDTLVGTYNGHYVNPHARAHIEILDELSLHERLRWMDSNGKPHNFDGLLDARLDATVDSARRSTNWSPS